MSEWERNVRVEWVMRVELMMMGEGKREGVKVRGKCEGKRDICEQKQK